MSLRPDNDWYEHQAYLTRHHPELAELHAKGGTMGRIERLIDEKQRELALGEAA